MGCGKKAWAMEEEERHERNQQEIFDANVKKRGLNKLRYDLNGLYHDLAHLNTEDMRLTRSEHQSFEAIMKKLREWLD